MYIAWQISRQNMDENCQIPKRKIQHEINPFINEVLSTLKETTRTKREFVSGDKGVANIITNSSTGQAVGETALMRYKKVDTEQFTKLYCTKIKNFFSMPLSVNLIFEYILIKLEKDKDQIYLYEQDIMNYTKVSSRSCQRGIQWLMDNDILAKTLRPHWFFINPTLFFNGDRLTLIEVYQRGDRPGEIQLPENTEFLNQIE